MLKGVDKGELIVPIVSLVFTIYALFELIIADYRASIIYYTLGISIIIFICSIGIVLDTYKAKGKVKELIINKRMILFIIGISILVLLLEKIGYLIGFFIFIMFLLRLVGRTNIIKNIIFAIVTTAVLYFMFVSLLGMGLPKGIIL